MNLFLQGLKNIIPNRLRPIYLRKEYNIYSKDLNDAVEIKEVFDFKILKSSNELESLCTNGYFISELISSDTIQKGFENKSQLLACVFHEKLLVHTTWFSYSSLHSVFDSIFRSGMFEEDNVGYIGPCQTSEMFRGRGIYTIVLENVCSYLFRKGVKKALINCRANNYSSIKGILKAGFKLKSTMVSVTILGQNSKKILFKNE
jgi:hypothetical protein